MKSHVNTSVTLTTVLMGTTELAQQINEDLARYTRRIEELEAMLKDQIAYKEAIVAAHVLEMERLRAH